ncbi:hypothetical protein SLEP1_g53595 [Rubroshorea leprosula]|uniref:Uncharacterized protein n=1 Tax=Rubroshorea leprosula TaxID=152421 RepID=A0AAV5M9Y8_9ROSI|nr:hypothetical protein SLEP1_g53595 [Rubroshorea leprosula]
MEDSKHKPRKEDSERKDSDSKGTHRERREKHRDRDRRDRETRPSDKDKSSDSDERYDRDRERERDKEKHRDKRDCDDERERVRDRKRDREDREKDKEKDRERAREKRERDREERERERERRERDREREGEKRERDRKLRDEVDQAQKKKRKMEEEVRGNEVVEFVPHPAPIELDSDLRETEVPTSGKVMLMWQTVTWVIVLAKEFLELVKDRNSLQKKRDELLKKNSEMRRELDIVVPAVTSLQEERDTLKTILSFEENDAQEEKITRMRESEVEMKKNVQLLIHNGMDEHIGNFINSSTFDNIINLYRLPTAILAFIDCKKKVKTEYLEVDITKITFGEQEKGVEENDESLSADFRPQVKLRWDHDDEGCAVFPPNFDFEFVAIKEEEGEAEWVEFEKSQSSPPVKVHPVPSEEEQPPLLVEQEPPQPPPPAE